MNKFYFKHRNCGTDPDTNKYYFSSIDELINHVDVLKHIQDRSGFIRWSVSPSDYNSDQYALMSEYWTTESRGVDTPLKCKGWFVCGYIYTDETHNSIFDLLPEWKADYRNHFIESRYMNFSEFSKLTDLAELTDIEKELCIKDGGIILNKIDW